MNQTRIIIIIIDFRWELFVIYIFLRVAKMKNGSFFQENGGLTTRLFRYTRLRIDRSQDFLYCWKPF